MESNAALALQPPLPPISPNSTQNENEKHTIHPLHVRSHCRSYAHYAVLSNPFVRGVAIIRSLTYLKPQSMQS